MFSTDTLPRELPPGLGDCEGHAVRMERGEGGGAADLKRPEPAGSEGWRGSSREIGRLLFRIGVRSGACRERAEAGSVAQRRLQRVLPPVGGGREVITVAGGGIAQRGSVLTFNEGAEHSFEVVVSVAREEDTQVFLGVGIRSDSSRYIVSIHAVVRGVLRWAVSVVSVRRTGSNVSLIRRRFGYSIGKNL